MDLAGRLGWGWVMGISHEPRGLVEGLTVVSVDLDILGLRGVAATGPACWLTARWGWQWFSPSGLPRPWRGGKARCSAVVRLMLVCKAAFWNDEKS